MNSQWSLYFSSSLILLVLLKITVTNGNLFLSCVLVLVLALQVVGSVVVLHQKKHKKQVRMRQN